MRRFLIRCEDWDTADVMTVDGSEIKITSGKHTFTYIDDGNGVHITDSTTSVYLDYGVLSNLLTAVSVSKEINGPSLMDVTVTEQSPDITVEF